MQNHIIDFSAGFSTKIKGNTPPPKEEKPIVHHQEVPYPSWSQNGNIFGTSLISLGEHHPPREPESIYAYSESMSNANPLILSKLNGRQQMPSPGRLSSINGALLGTKSHNCLPK